MNALHGYNSPGGGRIELRRRLTFEERLEYVKWLEQKGLCVLPEQIAVENGMVVIKEKGAVQQREKDKN